MCLPGPQVPDLPGWAQCALSGRWEDADSFLPVPERAIPLECEVLLASPLCGPSPSRERSWLGVHPELSSQKHRLSKRIEP